MVYYLDFLKVICFRLHSKTILLPIECIKKFRRGVQKLGLMTIIDNFQQFLFLLQPSNSNLLTTRKLNLLLKANFSEEGSNKRLLENAIYGFFNRYTREVAAGRRNGLCLEDILRFTTGTPEEPPLGFGISPCIEFAQVADLAAAKNKWAYLPTSNTCINKVTFPVGVVGVQLPEDPDLFEVYDHAFLNKYFGKV